MSWLDAVRKVVSFIKGNGYYISFKVPCSWLDGKGKIKKRIPPERKEEK